MATPFELTRLQDILYEEIPLSAAMEIELIPDAGSFVVEAPLAPNRNLQQTFFGGSLTALGLVAAWSWIRLSLREARLEPDLVVQDSKTDFVAPATGRTRARPHPPSEERWARFLRGLERFGRGRLEIAVTLESPVPGRGSALVMGSRVPEPVLAARLSGRFVAIEVG